MTIQLRKVQIKKNVKRATTQKVYLKKLKISPTTYKIFFLKKHLPKKNFQSG